MATLWHGRFGSGPADELLAYTVSLSFDRRLARDDIAGSRAHVRMLGHVGLLDEAEVRDVIDALDVVEAELAGGSFPFAPGDEDIHTAVERRVTELAGAAGAKLHTGRSRNDQVATDLRLFTKRELATVVERVLVLQETLLQLARDAGDQYLPGYTHLQRAQPVLLAHHFLAHGWALSRDVDRLLDARRRLDVSPLGAGALAGSSLPLDPDFTARELGFAARFENSLDAVSDRDFVAEALFALTLLAVHLSRIGEEFVLWSSDEFGFVRLADGYSTGSSMLPQKKNPDIAELARGKAGRLIGSLTGLLATLKGLPLAYNRDLQEDKEPLFDALDQIVLGLSAITGMLASSTYRGERMRAAADNPYGAAVDLAEFLVAKGMPFRDAHEVVGALVRQSIDDGADFVALVEQHDALGADAATLLAAGVAVTRRTTPGGAGPLVIGTQIERFASRIAVDRERVDAVNTRRRLVPRSFYARAPDIVARELLNKVLIGPNGSGRIVEVEAYDGARDPASHAYRGATARNAVMFGRPGHLYVYFTYGMHWCANAVCRQDGDAAAVLLRALAPIDGLDRMRVARRGVRRDRDLCSGPAKLCQALGIGPPHNGVDITRAASPVRIVDDGTAPPHSPTVTTRVGVSVGVDQRWRWYVAGDENVSRR